MDTYVSLEYKCHRDMATNVKLWIDANPNKVFFFQQEVNAPMSIGLNFFIEIQTASQRKLMVDLGHQSAMACDATFKTNEKKVL